MYFIWWVLEEEIRFELTAKDEDTITRFSWGERGCLGGEI